MSASLIKTTYQAAVKVGGLDMPDSKQVKVFGCNSELRRGVFLALRKEHYGQAVLNKTVGSPDTLSALNGFKSDMAAAIVLRLEHKLGRRLSAERVRKLVAAYHQVRAQEVPVGNTNVFPLRRAA